MKRIFLALLLLAPIVFGVSSLGGSLTLNMLRQVPNPAEPGQAVDTWFDVYASEPQKNVVCKIVPDYPFTLYPHETGQKMLGELPARQAWAVRIKLRVDAGALVGNNNISFGCKTASSPFLYANESIYVQPQSANLAIEKVETTPERVSPGQAVHVALTLNNLAATGFKNVRVTLNVSDPFVPVKSGSEKILDSIKPGEKKTITFDLLASPDAESKAYRIPVKLKFQDNAGTAYTEEDGIGVQIGGMPDLNVEMAESTLLRPNVLGKVTLKIINRGSENVQFLSANIGKTSQFKTTASDSQYIGSVASDDFESVELNVYANEKNPVIPVTLRYRDAANQPHEQTFLIIIPTYTEEEIKQFKLEPQGENNWIVVLAVLAVLVLIGRWALKKWGKK